MTKNSPQDVALKHLQVLGLPTILFFNAEGQEQPERRVTGLYGCRGIQRPFARLASVSDTLGGKMEENTE